MEDQKKRRRERTDQGYCERSWKEEKKHRERWV
jgi:hypothetical protein